MIQSKNDLKFYLQEDMFRNLGCRKMNPFAFIAKRIYNTEGMMAFCYLRSLRKYEFSLNCLKNKGLIGQIACFFYKWHNHRLGRRYNISIGANMVGYGFRIPHVIGDLIINCNSIGCNCCANTGVVIGNRHTENDRPTIGDNVGFGVGSKAFGTIKIGDNVFDAPNAVVTKDVPNDCVVAGIPAKIIMKDGKKVE